MREKFGLNVGRTALCNFFQAEEARRVGSAPGPVEKGHEDALLEIVISIGASERVSIVVKATRSTQATQR